MKEVTEWDGKPRWMWVWDDAVCEKTKLFVVCILTEKEMEEANYSTFPVFTSNRTSWRHCAEITEEEPTYRPYKSVDEMLDDFCERCREHGMTVSRSPMGEPFIWLLSKDGKTLKLVTGFDEGNGIYKVIIDGKLATFQSIFEFYTYKDGSPCGKKVKE